MTRRNCIRHLSDLLRLSVVVAALVVVFVAAPAQALIQDSNSGTSYILSYVGIGTTSPLRNLHVAGTSGSTEIISEDSTVAWSTVGRIWRTRSAGGSYYIDAMNGPLTSGLGAMMINSSGYVGIGTTSPGAPFQIHVASNTEVQFNSTGSGEAYMQSVNSPVNAYQALDFYGATITNHNMSDARLKTNIKDLNREQGLDAIARLRPVTFHWRSRELDEKRGEQIGLIAQEVQPVFPKLVSVAKISTLRTDANDAVPNPLTLNYEGLIVPLVKAVQELKAVNDNEAAQIKTLTERIEALEAVRR